MRIYKMSKKGKIKRPHVLDKTFLRKHKKNIADGNDI